MLVTAAGAGCGTVETTAVAGWGPETPTVSGAAGALRPPEAGAALACMKGSEGSGVCEKRGPMGVPHSVALSRSSAIAQPHSPPAPCGHVFPRPAQLVELI